MQPRTLKYMYNKNNSSKNMFNTTNNSQIYVPIGNTTNNS